MKYKEAMDYMEGLKLHGGVQGLNEMQELCSRLGNPQNDLRFIRIAGTNGKSSVLACISTVLKCAGYKAGWYGAPIVGEYRERIQANGRPITKQGFCDSLEEVRGAAERMAADGMAYPAVLQIEMAAALLYFKRMGCEVVLWEDGADGQQDGANIAMAAIVSVFTPIGVGAVCRQEDTLEKSAENKVHIMKKGCPVISMEQKPEAEKVLRERAGELECPFYTVSKNAIKKVKYGVEKQCFTYGGYKDLTITLAGQYQIGNCALAVEVIRVLGEFGIYVSEGQMRKGLMQTRRKGSFTMIAKKPAFIVDSACNEDGAENLAQSVRFYYPKKRMIFIMGIMRDKEYDKVIRATYELAEHIITVTIPDEPKGMHAYELAKEIQQYHHSVTAADSIEEAVELSYLLADKDSVIIAFGSFSYLGNLIKIVEKRDLGRTQNKRIV